MCLECLALLIDIVDPSWVRKSGCEDVEQSGDKNQPGGQRELLLALFIDIVDPGWVRKSGCEDVEQGGDRNQPDER